MGFDHIVQLRRAVRRCRGWRWSPKGDRLAYFVRTEKERTLIVQNVLTRQDRRADSDEVGRRAGVADLLARRPDDRVRRRCAAAIGDIYTVDLETQGGHQPHRATTSPTPAPTYSPDGKFIIYNARVSGNQKLFRLDLDTKKKTQLTFGTQDETAAQFIDDHTIVFSSTATDPAVPLEPEVAKNGNIYNIWTLDLKTGELRQYTDALGGNWSPVVLNERQTQPDRLRQLLQGRVQHPHARAEGAAAHRGHAPTSARPDRSSTSRRRCSTRSSRRTSRKKGTFEKMFLEGRPPVNVGVTSNGDIFGGIAGQLRRRARRPAVQPVRRVDRAVPHAVAAPTSTCRGASSSRCRAFRRRSSSTASSAASSTIPRSRRSSAAIDAVATRTVRGGTRLRHLSVQPLSPRRAVGRAGAAQRGVQRPDPAGALAAVSAAALRPAGLPQRHAGAARRRVHPGDDGLPRVRAARRQHDAARLRRRRRRSAACCRGRPSTSTRATTCGIGTHRPAGDAHPRASRASATSPTSSTSAATRRLRGYDYLQFAGQNVVFANAELRFPLIEAALTPIGVIGGVRGVFFANIGGGWFNNQPASKFVHARPRVQVHDDSATAARRSRRTSDRSATRSTIATGLPSSVRRAARPCPGFRLQDGARLVRHRASRPSRSASRFTSTGRGARCSTRTGRTSSSPPTAAAPTFRKPRFAVWIGYDF